MGLLGSVVKGVSTGGLLPLSEALLKNGSGGGYTPNIAPQLNEINKSATTQNGLVSGLTPKLTALNTPYQANVHQNGVDYQQESRDASQKFLNDIGTSGDQIGESLSQALQRRTMAAQPAINNSLRESLAANGGLARGGADQAFIQQASDTSRNLFEGNQDIVNNQNKARQDAMTAAYNVDEGLIKDRLGIDQDTLAQLYASGRTDLISEANQLLGIEQNRSGQTLNALGYEENANLAKSQADKQSQNALLSALLGTGGTVAGAYLGGPTGAAAGGTVGRGIVKPA